MVRRGGSEVEAQELLPFAEAPEPRGRVPKPGRVARARWGYRRDGKPRRKPGRKPSGKRVGSPHKKRPVLKGRFPVHVVLRVVDDLARLRTRHAYRAVREATIAVALRELSYKAEGAFRIVHISLQRTHVHLLVEADHQMALSRGMQSFQISAAKHLNRELSRGRDERRRGTVFPDRFHEEIIETPRQARHALAYVLNNWRKHREDREGQARRWNVDPFSTGVLFTGWRELEGAEVMWRWRETYQPMVVYLPRTWLLSEGWRMYSSIPFHEVPGSKTHARARRNVAA